MELTHQQFNRVLEVFQEFGPRRRLTYAERWSEDFPAMTNDDARRWEELCREIEAFAYSIAERVRDGELDQKVASGMIAERYPHLNKDRVGHTFSQAMYFSMK
jgi:hypothetical protein